MLRGDVGSGVCGTWALPAALGSRRCGAAITCSETAYSLKPRTENREPRTENLQFIDPSGFRDLGIEQALALLQGEQADQWLQSVHGDVQVGHDGIEILLLHIHQQLVERE